MISNGESKSFSISVFFLDYPLSFLSRQQVSPPILLSLAGRGRNEIVSAMNIEDSIGILTLLDLIDEAMILLGHHLA